MVFVFFSKEKLMAYNQERVESGIKWTGQASYTNATDYTGQV